MNYFAYGSNMDVLRMKERMKKHYPPFHNRCAAHLRGYRLEFNKVAKDNLREGKANIVPDDSGLVEGALYNIDMTSLSTLDEKEGYPEHYLKIPIKVTLPSDGQEVCAITYIANPGKIRDSDGLKPTKEYMTHLLAGKDILSKSYFEWLQSIQTLD